MYTFWNGQYRKDLDWYSETLAHRAARRGSINVVEFIHDSGREITLRTIETAAETGQVSVLNWMKEHDLISADNKLWRDACFYGQTEVLDWLYENGYNIDDAVVQFAITRNKRNVVIWAREHGITFDEMTCIHAAAVGNLPMLQWLRENGCPWDARVIALARISDHEHVVEWAIANGCPTE